MSSRGFSAEIHKVVDNGKRLALFLGLAFLFVWIVAINMSINDLTPRWFQRQFEWVSDESVPPIFLSMALASLISAGIVWLFSGHGAKLFDIDAIGITREGLFRSKTYAWNDFELLEREVSTIVLHLKAEAREKMGPKSIKFDISGIDCSGPKLEALIVHYRPDLYRTLHVAHSAPSEDAVSHVAQVQTPDVSVAASPLSQRIARLRQA